MGTYSTVAIRLEKDDYETLKEKFALLPKHAQAFLAAGVEEGEETFGAYRDFVILAWPNTKWYYPEFPEVKCIVDFIHEIRDNTDHWYDYIYLGEEDTDNEYEYNGDQFFCIARSIEIN